MVNIPIIDLLLNIIESSFYNSSLEIGDGILLEEMKRTDLSIEEFVELAEFTKSLGLKIGLSFFRLEDFYTLGDDADCFDFYKVPSAECTNLALVQSLIDTGKQVMISTGGHELSKIKKALVRFNDENLVIFHCVANYPVKLGSQNLLFINKLFETMRKGIPKSGLIDSHSLDMFQSMMDQEMAKELSMQKGLGMGEMVYNDLSRMNKILRGESFSSQMPMSQKSQVELGE